MTNIEADAAARTRESSEGHEKQLAELKMAVEEEKMLRGQGRTLFSSVVRWVFDIPVSKSIVRLWKNNSTSSKRKDSVLPPNVVQDHSK